MLIALLIFAADVETLSANAGVAKVDQVLQGEPAIVHVLNWHWVPKDAFGKAEGLSGAELDREYNRAMATAAAVHRSVLRILDDQPAVYLEGLTDANRPIVAAELRALKPLHRELATFDPTEGDAARDLIAEHRQSLLRLGAAAELQLDGKRIKLLPAEGIEHEAWKAAPLSDEANQAREAAIVKRITKRDKPAVLVLGGGHDLSAAIRPTSWGYVRITPRGYPAE